MPGRVIINIARGDLESARKLRPRLFSGRWNTTNPNGVARELWPLLEANDRLGMVKALHQREASEVKELKIEKIWERTPFQIDRLMPLAADSNGASNDVEMPAGPMAWL